MATGMICGASTFIHINVAKMRGKKPAQVHSHTLKQWEDIIKHKLGKFDYYLQIITEVRDNGGAVKFSLKHLPEKLCQDFCNLE